MAIHIQLTQRSTTDNAGETITLHFPLDAARNARILAITDDIAPLLEQAENEYYEADSSSALEELGQQLYRWLDGDERFLSRTIDQLPHTSAAVALLIQQDACFDHLPWELLHDGNCYLVQRSPTAIIPVRWQPESAHAAVDTAQNRPLRVVFMATAPQEAAQQPLDFEREEARILTETHRHVIDLRVEESGNLTELGYLLGDIGPGETDVVHLTGHAAHYEERAYFLCEDEIGHIHRATAQEIAESLTHRPRLLFLSGCRTGQALAGGTIPSLAADLVAKGGIPAVLGWGLPVYDDQATTAAAIFYGGLAQGLSPVHALAQTYSHMLAQAAKNPEAGRHWHLLRLYARGQVMPTKLANSVEMPLVTSLRTPGRLRATTPQREPEFLDDERRVLVANRDNFVGRRRVLQACLRALRHDGTALGVVLYGMGGQGKSTLAHRLRQRWLQRTGQHRCVVIYGQLSEGLLLQKLNNGLSSQAARAQLNGLDSLRFRLLNGLEACDEQLLIILDNFEDNFEQDGGQPRLSDGSPLITGQAVQLLEDLLFAIAGSMDRGQEHRLLITSRYQPQLGQDRLYFHQLDRLGEEAVGKKVDRLAQASGKSASGLAPEMAQLRTEATKIADGNPRLLEWLFEVLNLSLGAHRLNMAEILAQMAEQETALRENILVAELLAAQTPALRQMLARGLTCQLPVPDAVFDILDTLEPIHPNSQRERKLATNLGLLESTTSRSSERTSKPHPVIPSSPHLRVPRILEPLLAQEAQPDFALCAAAAAQTLYTHWWEAEGVALTESQTLEIHRLALAGGEGEIAQEIADQLARRWNRADQYRYREVIDLVTQTVDQCASARLWNQIGYATNQLGDKQVSIVHYQAALDACTDEGLGLKGILYNNIGGTYDSLGNKEKALYYYNMALPLMQQVRDKDGAAATLNNIGSVYDSLDDKEGALRYYNKALLLIQQVGDKGGEATTLSNIGLVYNDLGEKKEALRYYNMALPLRKQVGDKGGEATTLTNIGTVYYSQGDKEEALHYFNMALPMHQEVGNKAMEATTLNNMGGVYSSLGDKQEALRYFNMALPLDQQVGDRWGEAVTRYNMAMVFQATGRLQEAVEQLEQVVAIEEATGHPDLEDDRATLARVRRALDGTADV